MKDISQPKPRVIVITGAAAGVGRATARMFAQTEGAHIGLIARGVEALEGARREVEELGGKALELPCDVADAEAVEAAAERVERELGPIDVWVNDAMTSVFSFIKDTTPADFKRVTEVCYLGYVNGTLAALKRMLPRDRGHIVQVGSALAYRGIPLQAAYCASKHAIQGFMDSLRAELIHDHSKIIATMVQMPALNTPQFDWCKSRLPHKAQPVPPIYQPEVAAEAIVFASKSNRRELYVGLPTVIAIVGNKLFPRLGDYYLGKTGVKGQQTAEKDDPDKPNNLYKPVGGDPGAHGRFDARARSFSWQFWLDKNRRAFALAGLGALIVSGVGLFLHGREDR
jgi:NAD(P)-dependent dehydrogenase (short-subunit alcohol dehydrogenase family)